MIDLKKMPKVELHVHLDGSIRIESLNSFYKRDVSKEAIANQKCLNLEDYLTKFSLPVSFLQTKENIISSCFNLSKDLEEDGVIYAEVRFSPIKLASLLTLDEVIDSVLEGFKQGNIPVGVILCMMRNDSIEANLGIINLASKYLGKGVVAVDLAGDEATYKTEDFLELFKVCRSKKIPFTIHAGEVNDEASIKNAISFGTTRLGHGIASINYPYLLNEIVNKKILLEVCPTSNVQTDIINVYKEHPIKKLIEKGAIVSINTDNRTVSNITLTDEYKNLMDNFGFTIHDFCKFNLDAIDYAFIDEDTKNLIRENIKEYLKINS